MFEVDNNGARKNVRITVDRLDILDSTNLLQSMQKEIDSAEKSVVLDMSELEFMDSAVLGVFVRLNEIAKRSEKEIIFSHLTSFVKNLFRHSRMDSIFKIE